MDDSTILPNMHQVLIVEADGKKWLTDVGFGLNGLLAPILLQDGTEERQSSGIFRLIKDETYGFILQRKGKMEYKNVYAFTLEPYLPMDFEIMGFYGSKSSNIVYSQKIVCFILTKKGYISLIDKELKIEENKNITKITAETQKERNKLLKEYFGITL